MKTDEMRGYLAAFIDGEGHISCHVTSRGKITKGIEFVNTEKPLFDAVVTLAAELGFTFSTYFRKRAKPHWSDTWIARLAGGKPALQKFYDEIPLRSERKRAQLLEVIQSYRGAEELEKIYATRRTRVECACKQCGKDFWAFPADLKRGHGIFCSHECWAAARVKQVKKTCLTCGCDYTVPPSRQHKTKYCSQRCFGLSQAERLRAGARYASDRRWHRERL